MATPGMGGYGTMGPLRFVNGTIVVDMSKAGTYGGTWTREGGYAAFGSSEDAFLAGVDYVDRHNGWRNTQHGSYEKTAIAYASATGQAVLLRVVTILEIQRNPNWLQHRIDEHWARVNFVDGFQSFMDGVGLIPGFGEVADGINAGIYYARGDNANGSLSLAAMVPLVGWGATGGKVILKMLPWSSLSLGKAAKLLENGASSVTVRNREEAEELFMGLFQGGNGRSLINTTGLNAVETKSLYGSKSGTYHWDLNDTQHGGIPHLQIHDFDGNVIRIFFGQ